VSSKKDKMGLTSWRRSPKGKIMPSDISIAKNYLDKKELTELNRIVNMYLDYAEMQAARSRAITMKDWIEKLNALNNEVRFYTAKEEDYIFLTDIARYKNSERTDYIIQNWLRNRNTIEFLGIWEHLNNPDFNLIEFDGIKKQAGLKRIKGFQHLTFKIVMSNVKTPKLPLSFDEKLKYWAYRKIELDLDDGVKINYDKFGDLLIEVKEVTGKKKKNGDI